MLELDRLVNPGLESSTDSAEIRELRRERSSLRGRIRALENKSEITQDEQLELNEIRTKLQDVESELFSREGFRSFGDDFKNIVPAVGQSVGQVVSEGGNARLGDTITGASLGFQAFGPLGALAGGVAGNAIGLIRDASAFRQARNQTSARDIIGSEFNRTFEDGGHVNSSEEFVPIQTEKYKGTKEQIIYGTSIYDVHADKPHEKMDKGEATDYVKPGSYIASARRKLSKKDVESVYAFGIDSYTEADGSVSVKEKTLEKEFDIKKGDSFATAAKKIKRKAKVKKDEHGDNFLRRKTNGANRATRAPALAHLITLHEANLGNIDMEDLRVQPVASFMNGGPVGSAGPRPTVSPVEFGTADEGLDFNNNETPLGPLSAGDVSRIQQWLLDNGCGPVAPGGGTDGRWGDLTDTAWVKCQSKAGESTERDCERTIITKEDGKRYNCELCAETLPDGSIGSSTPFDCRPLDDSISEIGSTGIGITPSEVSGPPPLGGESEPEPLDFFEEKVREFLDLGERRIGELVSQSEDRARDDEQFIRGSNLRGVGRTAIALASNAVQDPRVEVALVNPATRGLISPQQIQATTDAAFASRADEIAQIGGGSSTPLATAQQSVAVGRSANAIKTSFQDLAVNRNLDAEDFNSSSRVQADNINEQNEVNRDDQERSNLNQKRRNTFSALDTLTGVFDTNAARKRDFDVNNESDVNAAINTVQSQIDRLVVAGLTNERAKDFLAKQMVEQGYSNEQIAAAVGLSIEEIEVIKRP